VNGTEAESHSRPYGFSSDI